MYAHDLYIYIHIIHINAFIFINQKIYFLKHMSEHGVKEHIMRNTAM